MIPPYAKNRLDGRERWDRAGPLATETKGQTWLFLNSNLNNSSGVRSWP